MRVPFIVRATDRAGNVIPGAVVRVRGLGGGTVTDVFAARAGGSALAQPVGVDFNGKVVLWVEPGEYEWNSTANGETSAWEPWIPST